MRRSSRPLRIATRRSRLALVQAESIAAGIRRLSPGLDWQLVPMTSDGDQVLDHPLSDLGGKGLFTATIEQALIKKSADVAVHSLKDMPADSETAGLTVAAIPPRAPTEDLLICASASRLEDLPRGATLGTCSKRRAAQALRLRPDLKIVPLRGNVQTRLERVLVDKKMDATLLAAAGLKRLGIDEPCAHPIPLETVLPAAGQGALAVQCRLDDHTTLKRCIGLNDTDAALAAHTERTVVSALGADCHSPIAVLCERIEDRLHLRARVLSPEGTTCLESDRTGPIQDAHRLAAEAVEELTGLGARQILKLAAG
ncbi:MAG: hydroxymethylbilane synthase [Phycisphaeraceae bacterium]|nr:hydroxymethylbilane synthase [Phycisphaeraceae bacterium]